MRAHTRYGVTVPLYHVCRSNLLLVCRLPSVTCVMGSHVCVCVCIGRTQVDKGSDICISVWNLHRSPQLWQEPEAFKPER